MAHGIIKGHICPLIEPTMGECWACDREDMIVAWDTQVKEPICYNCLESAINIDIFLQLCYGTKLYHKKRGGDG